MPETDNHVFMQAHYGRSIITTVPNGFVITWEDLDGQQFLLEGDVTDGELVIVRNGHL